MNLFKRYIEKIRQVKSEHFNDISEMEDTIHKQKLKFKEQEFDHSKKLEEQSHKHKREMEDLESKYKRQTEDLVAKHEKELAHLSHGLSLEREKFEVEKEKMTMEHERTMNAEKIKIQEEAFKQFKETLERELSAKDGVNEAYLRVLESIKSTVPVVTKTIEDSNRGPHIAVGQIDAPKKKKSRRKPRKKASSGE